MEFTFTGLLDHIVNSGEVSFIESDGYFKLETQLADLHEHFKNTDVRVIKIEMGKFIDHMETMDLVSRGRLSPSPFTRIIPPLIDDYVFLAITNVESYVGDNKLRNVLYRYFKKEVVDTKIRVAFFEIK
ncbi:hypothetical protein FDI40_gp453 [Agrobacterium phage Atu_ph07]|uniref:Uncharacterized protein n=1 Tax=Agrobacterium phage Atu_ph07 TaxID=2024264 RepID=A0A2L0V067_9CAUD|nr:hypothetical protein FDI40_gp453 [Agrobacterium phage Atu_ph07]AUZ95212.1 hypothetical protein [Agrobacterium phage Atu_ph07]